MLGDVRGRGRASGGEVADRWAWIIDLSDGKAASLRGFVDQREALAAAGLSEYARPLLLPSAGPMG